MSRYAPGLVSNEGDVARYGKQWRALREIPAGYRWGVERKSSLLEREAGA